MTYAEKITFLQSTLGDSAATSALLTSYLSIAESVIMGRRYPFGIPEDATFPTAYDYLHIQLTERLWQKRGAEGEISHSENGISRSYDSVDEEDLLSRIVPIAKVSE